jgi:probable phosphoglycerate mutase
MRHTLRGGNKEADRLANEAMDRGTGKSSCQLSVVSGQSFGGVSGASKPALTVAPAPAPAKRVVLEGYVKGGVVHLLEGELPDGVFVKVIRE